MRQEFLRSSWRLTAFSVCSVDCGGSLRPARHGVRAPRYLSRSPCDSVCEEALRCPAQWTKPEKRRSVSGFGALRAQRRTTVALLRAQEIAVSHTFRQNWCLLLSPPPLTLSPPLSFSYSVQERWSLLLPCHPEYTNTWPLHFLNTNLICSL